MLDPEVYPDIEGFWADLAAAYADEVRRLGELGCTYLQFDDTSLAYLNDPAQRAEISGRGEDAEHMHLRYISQINMAVKDKRPAWRSRPTCAGGTTGPPGRPPAATTLWPRPCSPS